MLAVMLRELAARTSWDWARIIDIQRRVLSYRHQVHDLSTDLEEDGYALLESVDRNGLAGLPTSSSTAHVSAVDSDGTACAITASSGYGSGATVPGTGLMLNNCLGEPELNRLGLHALAPGTRLASNMAPSVARSVVGGGARDRQPGGRPDHHGAHAGARPALPRRHADAGGDRRAAGARADPRRRHAAGRPRGRRGDRRGHRRRLALPSFSHGAHVDVLRRGRGGRRLADGALDAAGDPRREAATRISP